jgi:Tfp pilus assembly protein PilX
MRIHAAERGTILVAVLILAAVMAAFCLTALVMSSTEIKGTEMGIRRDRALFVASGGMEDAFSTLNDMMKPGASSSLGNVQALAGTKLIARRALVSSGHTIGEYEVTVSSVVLVNGTACDVSLTSTGYIPSASYPQAVTRNVTAVVRVGTGRSEVFDYAYFINNWGWYYGDTIVANGNVRANGQFDGGGHKATVNAIPRFTSCTNGVLGDQIDSGGVYAAWNIIASANLGGSVKKGANLHPWVDPVKMPNLTDLSSYEQMAKDNKSSISIGGNVVCNAVVGDEAGEKSNLYLVGTTTNPIVLNGTVVVRGDVIIKGYVKGKGAIYASGNVYVAGNLRYTSPIQAPPTTPDRNTIQAWLTANASADALGIFARQHIVVGDYTDSTWQSYVGQWVTNKLNRSDEDLGLDGIPNTKAGRDGKLGTADDDVLEDDGKWTVQRYTQDQASQGLIPKGAKVGDAIPGSGEDVDGDGKYTTGVALNDFTVKSPLNSQYWQGNMPSGVTSYRQLTDSASSINQLDGAFYTNHTFAALALDYSHDLTFNGCLVSRNEDIIYGAKRCVFNYDLRLLEAANPHGLVLPSTPTSVQLVMWKSD